MTLHEYRVKPTHGYGTRRSVKISMCGLDNNLVPRGESHLRLDYENCTVVCYNPMRLAFNVNHVISHIQTIHGIAKKISTVKESK